MAKSQHFTNYQKKKKIYQTRVYWAIILATLQHNEILQQTEFVVFWLVKKLFALFTRIKYCSTVGNPPNYFWHNWFLLLLSDIHVITSMWSDPNSPANVTSVFSVDDLLRLACCSVLPGGGTNIELALHCLFQCKGDVMVRPSSIHRFDITKHFWFLKQSNAHACLLYLPKQSPRQPWRSSWWWTKLEPCLNLSLRIIMQVCGKPTLPGGHDLRGCQAERVHILLHKVLFLSQ